MLLRGKSKDRDRRVTPPGPSYMSNDQFAQYLANLRNTRVARPSGARPQPATTKRRDSDRILPAESKSRASEDAHTELPPRSSSVLSMRRNNSSLSNYSSTSSRTGRALVQPPTSTKSSDGSQPAPVKPLKPSEVVPSATYMERGQRWMEKEEAVSLREAMEDMDLKQVEEEETRIHTAAQNEASELVFQHQNPDSVPKPEAPYRYNGHLRKNSYAHARTQSVGRYGGLGLATGLARDLPPRSVSGSSSGSGGMKSPQVRLSMEPSDYFGSDNHPRQSMESTKTSGSQRGQHPLSRPSGRRRPSGKRNISGEIAGAFTGEQIFEEPEQDEEARGRSSEGKDLPSPLRIKAKNPLNRVQFAQDTQPRSSSTPPETTQKLSKYEIHRNPPSQSRNPAYTANPVPPPRIAVSDTAESKDGPSPGMKNGLEIRGEDIRQATSMLLKDRSPKLPTPVVVSDKPGRPIVSFDKNWKPKEADVKPEEQQAPRINSHPSSQTPEVTSQTRQKAYTSAIPSIQLPETPTIQVNNTPVRPGISITAASAPIVPTINLPGVPSISISGIPSINVTDGPPAEANSCVPSISLPGSDAKPVAFKTRPLPSINMPPSSTRPLPNPKSLTGRPLPRHNATAPLPRGHWSPAIGNRATATCHQCQLPIEGRVVSLRGISERFHPQCFICYTCGTGLEALEISPEPALNRTARIDRIKRRAQGEVLDEIEGQTAAEDGDERLRFFCHLDWHEHFAPRCKHCKTPIIGEHAVALGEHWHYGHFFCAECGDPFEQGMTHIEKDGYAWCLSCQTKRTERRAPKCKKCKGPVIGQYVQALGGEWHDACFRCATCNGGFDDGQIFPKQDGVVLCTGCMERELKA